MQIDLLPGGTSRGYGFWTNWVEGCDRKPVFAENEERLGGLSRNRAIDIGIIMHEYQALYYGADTPHDSLALDTDEILFVDPSEPAESYLEEIVQEADRAFQAYRRRYRPDELGEVVEVEVTHRVHDFLGIQGFPFDIKPDLVVYLAEEREVHWSGEVVVLAPGYYIVDHKTMKAEGMDDAFFFKNGLRFQAYQLAWNELAEAGEVPGPCEGLIINSTYYGSRINFGRALIESPKMLDTLRVKGLMTQAFDKFNQFHGMSPILVPCVPTHCVDRFGGQCKYLSKCRRY